MSMNNTIIPIKMAALGISQQQLAFYTGIGTQKLSPLLSGQRDLDAVSLTKIYDALAALERLAEVSSPWPIDFRQVVAVKRLMEQLKYGELDRLIAATRDAVADLVPAGSGVQA
jgi:transcriptional regulator with XRE-family HTH domain